MGREENISDMITVSQYSRQQFKLLSTQMRFSIAGNIKR